MSLWLVHRDWTSKIDKTGEYSELDFVARFIRDS